MRRDHRGRHPWCIWWWFRKFWHRHSGKSGTGNGGGGRDVGVRPAPPHTLVRKLLLPCRCRRPRRRRPAAEGQTDRAVSLSCFRGSGTAGARRVGTVRPASRVVGAATSTHTPGRSAAAALDPAASSGRTRRWPTLLLPCQSDLLAPARAVDALTSRRVRVPSFTFKLGVHSAGSELPPHEHDERHQAATTSIAVGALALELPVESAPRAGFYDQSPFTNMFRRVVGFTPAACRAQAAPSP